MIKSLEDFLILEQGILYLLRHADKVHLHDRLDQIIRRTLEPNASDSNHG